MSLYAISDLHLSLCGDKSMTVFNGWGNYLQRIESNWNRIVLKDDTVILPGDISWGLKLSESLEDLKFLNGLNGKKIILKGNHDLWWTTVKKVNEFFNKNKFESLNLLYNNAVFEQGFVICGTRGWFYDESADSKIRKREAGRLRRSLEAAETLEGERRVFLHYPPVYGDYVCDDILNILKEYKINKVYYGHIHGSGFGNTVNEYDGISFKLISADCIDFSPVLIT